MPPRAFVVWHRNLSYEPRGALARRQTATATSLPDTNINPEMTFKINSSMDLRYNLQDDLQGELRKREESQLQAVFRRCVRKLDSFFCDVLLIWTFVGDQDGPEQ